MPLRSFAVDAMVYCFYSIVFNDISNRKTHHYRFHHMVFKVKLIFPLKPQAGQMRASAFIIVKPYHYNIYFNVKFICLFDCVCFLFCCHNIFRNFVVDACDKFLVYI